MLGITSIGKDGEELEFSYTDNKKVNCFSYFREIFEGIKVERM